VFRRGALVTKMARFINPKAQGTVLQNMGIVNYLKETKGEMKHVSWPSQRQTVFFTVIIIIISFATSAFLGFFDFVFTFLLRLFVI